MSELSGLASYAAWATFILERNIKADIKGLDSDTIETKLYEWLKNESIWFMCKSQIDFSTLTCLIDTRITKHQIPHLVWPMNSDIGGTSGLSCNLVSTFKHFSFIWKSAIS